MTERIPRDAADQRAGRACRLGPGRVTRLWDERDILRPHRDPEERRVDLAGPALDILAGGNPCTFPWFERPPGDRLDAAMSLLAELGAVTSDPVPRLTAVGDQLRAFPLHPRLGRVVLAAHGADDAIRLAAELSEGRSDPQQVQEIAGIARRVLGDAYARGIDDETFRRARRPCYPDRVALRREPGSPRFPPASGTGATLAREVEATPANSSSHSRCGAI